MSVIEKARKIVEEYERGKAKDQARGYHRIDGAMLTDEVILAHEVVRLTPSEIQRVGTIGHVHPEVEIGRALATALSGDKEREADPFFQPFDCHYDGVWNICDKQGCHDEEQCKRRTSGPKNAAPQESVRGATPARPAVAAPSPYSLGYNELAERVVELERELAEARTIEQELGAIIRKQNDAIAVSHVAALTPDWCMDAFWRANPGRNAVVPSLYLLDFAREVLRVHGVQSATARRDIVEECWQAIDAMIVRGDLPGNGTDKSAQRNGLILACNKLFELGAYGRSKEYEQMEADNRATESKN
jgi:hypothetical protein